MVRASDEGVARRDPGRSITLKLIVGGQESAPAGLLMRQGRSIVVKACLHFASREVAHSFDRRAVGAVADVEERTEDCAGQVVVVAVVLAVAAAEGPSAL